MPKVVSESGTKHFPYTKDGIRRARIYANNVGGKLIMNKTVSKSNKTRPTGGY